MSFADKQIEQTWARVVERHDTAALECILATEFEEAGATGELMNRSQMLAGARSYGDVHYALSETHAQSMATSVRSAVWAW